MRTYASVLLGVLLFLPPVASPQARRQPAAGRVDETTRVINDCESRTNSFKRHVRRKARGDAPNLQRDVDDLEKAMNEVGDSWNKDHNMQKTRAYVTAAITVSQRINRFMTAYRGDPDLVNEWVPVRAELNRLAQTFGLPAIRW